MLYQVQAIMWKFLANKSHLRLAKNDTASDSKNKYAQGARLFKDTSLSLVHAIFWSDLKRDSTLENKIKKPVYSEIRA